MMREVGFQLEGKQVDPSIKCFLSKALPSFSLHFPAYRSKLVYALMIAVPSLLVKSSFKGFPPTGNPSSIRQCVGMLQFSKLKGFVL